MLETEAVQLAQAGPEVAAEAIPDLGPTQELAAVAGLLRGAQDLEHAIFHPAKGHPPDDAPRRASIVRPPDRGLQPIEVPAHRPRASGRHLTLDRAGHPGEGLGLADAGAREMVERQVQPHEVAQAGLGAALERKVLAGEEEGPLRGRRPEGLEVVSVGEEHAFPVAGHEVQVRVGEVHRELAPRGAPSFAAPASRDVVEEEAAVEGSALVPLGPGPDVGKEEPALRGRGTVVEDARHRPLEGAGKLALLELVDDVHLVLDRVPDVEVVVPGHVHDLASEAVVLRAEEEGPCRPIGLLVAGHREIEDVAEEDQVVDLPDHSPEGRDTPGPRSVRRRARSPRGCRGRRQSGRRRSRPGACRRVAPPCYIAVTVTVRIECRRQSLDPDGKGSHRSFATTPILSSHVPCRKETRQLARGWWRAMSAS